MKSFRFVLISRSLEIYADIVLLGAAAAADGERDLYTLSEAQDLGLNRTDGNPFREGIFNMPGTF